jgi:hypothetical protein
MIQVAPQEVPGWLAVCGVLSADAILKLTTRLCQTLSGGRAHLLIASAQRLAERLPACICTRRRLTPPRSVAGLYVYQSAFTHRNG